MRSDGELLETIQIHQLELDQFGSEQSDKNLKSLRGQKPVRHSCQDCQVRFSANFSEGQRVEAIGNRSDQNRSEKNEDAQRLAFGLDVLRDGGTCKEA